MKWLLILILIALNIGAVDSKFSFSKKAPKVEPGCIVPFQSLFIATNSIKWKDRAAQVWCESNFNPTVINSIGAKGLGQFMDGAWKDWGKGSPLNPQDAIIAQNRYMVWLEMKCRNSNNAALASYNAGLGNIRKAQFLADKLNLVSQDAWMQTLPRITGKFSTETLNYIKANNIKRQLLM